MAENVIKMRIDSSEYESKLKRAADGLRRFGEEATGAGKCIDVADNEMSEYVKMIGQMETVNRSAKGKINELSSAFVELSEQYRHLTDEEKNSPFGQALASSLEQLKTRVHDGKKELEDISKELNNTGDEGKETGGMLKQLADRFTINIDAMKLFDIGLKAINGALSVAKDAFFASESNVDEWGRTVEAAKSVYNGFLNAINTGDISGFLSRIDDIVSAARKAYDELDKLGTMKTIQGPQISGQQAENDRLRMMLRTGVGIQAMSGSGQMFDRLFGIKNGEKLNDGVIRIIEARLKNGMDKIVDLTFNEVKQTNKSIDAFYDKLAKENGMSLAEFRNGTSSWAEFSKRMSEYDKYNQWKKENSYTDMWGYSHAKEGNPYQGAEKWGVFRVDGESFKNLVQLIQQRDAQMSSVYGMQMQAYRAVNTAENRLTPHGGSGGGGGGGATTNLPGEIAEITGLIEIQEQKIKDLRTAWRQAATKEGIEDYRRQIKIATMEYNELIGKSSIGGVSVFGGVDISPNITAIEEKMQQVIESSREIANGGYKVEDSWKAAASAVQSVGSALQQIEDPGAKIAGLIGQAIANIALGFAQATASDSKLGVFGWIAAIAGGMATMLSTISAIHSATGYAEGGIVKGNTYSGDQIPADSFVNAGELILNRAQQNSIASLLTEGSRSGGGGNGLARVSGEQIYIAMSNYLRRSGKGELVTWR